MVLHCGLDSKPRDLPLVVWVSLYLFRSRVLAISTEEEIRNKKYIRKYQPNIDPSVSCLFDLPFRFAIWLLVVLFERIFFRGTLQNNAALASVKFTEKAK